jgi:hypothetical protein
VRAWLALAVTVLWAATYVGSLAVGDYMGFEISTPVMLIVATALLAAHHDG